MTGRSTCRAISRITSSLKTPGLPVVPISTVGLTRETTSSKENGPPPWNHSDSARRGSRRTRTCTGLARRARLKTRPCESSMAWARRIVVGSAPALAMPELTSRAMPTPAARAQVDDPLVGELARR